LIRLENREVLGEGAMNRRAGYQAALAFAVLLGVSAAVPARAVAAAPAVRESVLYRFAGGSDGSNPLAGLLADASGSLYGTTSQGGGSNFGIVFELNPPAAGQTRWTEFVLHRSRGATVGDAADFQGGLATDPAGVLYGTSARGGLGNGTVFQLIEESETETLLYQFLDGFDGDTPVGGLIRDPHGVFYGTTQGGGGLGDGTVFALTPPARPMTEWTEQIVHRFKGGATDGRLPLSGLLMDGAKLYGTTAAGGPGDFGTVFELTPPTAPGAGWNEKLLYIFKGGADGKAPTAGLIIDTGGALYGTTQNGGNSGCGFGAGCGTVFKLSPPAPGQSLWTETVLHRFTGGTDGASPAAGLIADKKGNLFGTTGFGGTGCPDGCGTVFELTPPAAGQKLWTETVLYAFRGGSDGERPAAGLTADANGVLYGTTVNGGTGCDDVGCGTVFELTGAGFVTSIPFSAFSTALLEIDLDPNPTDDAFLLLSALTLGANSNGIDPPSEPVALRVGPVTTQIPPGSFTRSGPGLFTFAGVINGVDLQLVIEAAGGKSYTFSAAGQGANLVGTTNPVPVMLAIGNDTGTASVAARIGP
jgi:uncharacterized repeat protein (TIGR03803 family)